MEVILKYFHDLSPKQVDQFQSLESIYRWWNSRINVISRKDMDQFYLHHVLHSLSIARYRTFPPDIKILDLGCGGGFPGIPLAIYFPDVKFHLVDSTMKKIKVVKSVADKLGLTNVRASHQRAESLDEAYHIIVTRAVARIGRLLKWTAGKYVDSVPGHLSPGLIALKGGNIDDELEEAGVFGAEVIPLVEYFKEDYFLEKKLIFIPR